MTYPIFTLTFDSPYIWIMIIGALILLIAQTLSSDRVLLYGILMAIGLLMIIIPVMIQVIEVIRFLI